MGISEKQVKIGVCDACARQIMEDTETGRVPGFLGEVEDTRTRETVEFFACSIPHIGKAASKLLAALQQKTTKRSRRQPPSEPATTELPAWTEPDDSTPAYNSMQGSFNGR